MERPSWLPGMRTITLWAGVAVGILFLWMIRAQLLPALSPFFFAILLAYLLNPLVEAVHRRRIPRTISILIIYGAFLFSLIMLGVYVIPIIVAEIEGLIKRLPELTVQVEQLFLNWQEQFSKINLPEDVNLQLQRYLGVVQSYLLTVLQGTVDFIFGFVSRIFSIVLTPILAFYMLKDKDIILRELKRLIPRKYQTRAVSLVTEINQTLGNWLRGQITVGFIVGFLTFIGLEIVGMDFSLVLGIVTGVTNIIPYFGPFIGAAPAILLALLRSPGLAIRVILVQLAAQQIESNFITPQILGRELGLHPLVIIFALLLGAQFGGVWGLLFAVPVAAVAKVVIAYFLRRKIDS